MSHLDNKATIRKNIRLSPALNHAIDQARGDVAWSRWVKRAIEDRLLQERQSVERVGEPESSPTYRTTSRWSNR